MNLSGHSPASFIASVKWESLEFLQDSKKGALLWTALDEMDLAVSENQMQIIKPWQNLHRTRAPLSINNVSLGKNVVEEGPPRRKRL